MKRIFVRRKDSTDSDSVVHNSPNQRGRRGSFGGGPPESPAKKPISSRIASGFSLSPGRPPPRRPRLDQAFTDELKMSVHQIVVEKQKKRTNPLKFLKTLRPQSLSNINSEDGSSKQPKRRITKKPPSRPASPRKIRVHTPQDSPESVAARTSKSQADGGGGRPRPSLRKDVADELKMSFTNRNAKKQSRGQQQGKNDRRVMSQLSELGESESEEETDTLKGASKGNFGLGGILRTI